MPLLSEVQKANLLQSRGLNPSEWDVDESSYTPIPKEPTLDQPSVAPTTIGPEKFPTTPEGSSFGAFAKSFAQAAPSSIAGGLGAGGGLALGTALAPETGGLSFLIPLLSTLVGGFGASAITRKAQESIEPESMQQDIAQAAAQHPIASKLGAISTIPLGGFNPSPSNLIRAGGGVAKLLTGAPMAENEISNLVNVGAGAGIGAGSDVVNQIGSGQPFDIKSLIESGALGALFNKPNPIGGLLGFHQPNIPTINDQLQGGLVRQPTDITTPQNAPITTTPIGPPTGFSPLDLINRATSSGIFTGPKERFVPTKSAEESAMDIARAKYEGQQPIPRQTAFEQSQLGEGEQLSDYQQKQLIRSKDEAIARQMQAEQDLLEQRNAKAELDRQEAAQLQSENAARALDLQQNLGPKFAQEKTVAPLATTELGKEIMPDYTGVIEHENLQAQKESAADLEARRLEGYVDKYQQESETPIKTKLQSDLLAQRERLPLSPTKQWFDTLKKWATVKRGITVDDTGTPIDASTGNPVAGQTRIKEGALPEIKLNLSDVGPQAGADTFMHEMGHALRNVMEQGGRGKDLSYWNKFDKIVSESPDYQTWKAQRDNAGLASTPEEYQMTNAGYQFLKSHLNVEGETPLKKWFNDFKSYLKTRFSKHATEEDFQRLLDYRLSQEAKSLPDYLGGLHSQNVPNSTVSTRMSDDSELSAKQKDITRYNELTDNARNAFRSGKEVPQDILQEIEDIKNRNGGFPPTTKQSESSELTSPKHESVRQFIDIAKTKTDDASIKPEDADELYKILLTRVDWSSMPKVKAELASPKFDSLDPDHWKKVEEEYNKAINQPSTVESSAIFANKAYNESLNKSSNVPAKPTKEKGQNVYGEKVIKPKERTVESTYKEIPKPQQDVIPPEMLTKEKASSDAEWNEVDNTKTPKTLAKQLRDKYEQALKYRNQLRDEGFSPNSVEVQMADRRLNGLELKYKVLIDRRGIAEPPIQGLENPEEYQSEYSLLPIVKPEIQPIKDLKTPEGDSVSKAIERFFPAKDIIYGKGMAPIIRAASKLSRKDLETVRQVLVKENDTKTDQSGTLTSKQLNLYDAIRQSLLQKQQDQIAANQPVTVYGRGTPTKRLPQIDPFYFPNRIDPKVAETFTDPKLRAKRDAYERDFLAHQTRHGISPIEAQAKWDSIISSYDETPKDYLTKFGANREMQGVGLPESMMRKGNLLGDLSAYYNRVSSDRAFHDTIESKPDVAAALNIQKDPWGNPIPKNPNEISGMKQVSNIMDRIGGEPFDADESKLKLANRIASSLMLGPLTNAHIMGSSIANVLNHVKPTEVPGAYTYAITHMNTSIEHILDTGYHRKDLSSWRDIISGANTSIDKMSALATKISNISGREITNKYTKGFLQGIGEFIIPIRAHEANLGNEQAINVMKQVDPEWISGKTYTPDEIIPIASNFASLVHGAHDARTLPGWMLKDTAIQPFFSLMSWNIAQTNQWMRHVFTPATKGNFTPLIMSTLGATLGGYVIKEAREKLSDKKSPIPSLADIAASSRGYEGNIPNVAYNLMAMSSYVGYAGIVSVAAKAVMDMAHKNIPQGAAFPLDELISNPVNRISQAVSAMMNDDNPSIDSYVKVGSRLAFDLARENIQLGRIATSWLANTGVTGESEQYSKQLNTKESDLRRFKMVEGLPYEAQTGLVGNPYMDMQMKQFKRTSDISEAVSQLPDLISAAVNKAGGNPEVLRSELEKLKKNNYQTMPDPDQMPLAFLRYMTFLSKTKGPDEASNRLLDYFQKREINKVKGELVPSI
jgi:hypothetical protein